jgi:hypothetical protein
LSIPQFSNHSMTSLLISLLPRLVIAKPRDFGK